MELRNLQTLVAVVREGGFSAAAKVLHTTQPTVSKSIQQLEYDCKAILLDRKAAVLRLTDAGEIVYRRALAILAEREHLQDDLSELKGVRRGRLRLGLPWLGSSILFAPIVAAYRKKYPGIEIDLRENGSRELEGAVRAGEIEVGASLRPIPSDFATQTVCDEPMMAVLPENHALAGRASVRLEELASSPFVLFEQSFVLNTLILEACAQSKFKPQVTARSRQTDFILGLVAAGLGVGLLPQLVVRARKLPSVKVVELVGTDLRWRLDFIWRKEAELSKAAQCWLELAEEKNKDRR
ncbi:MAG: LysR family transcriptional regulator [Puniceicoccales bacterium]|jgi:DNA-binding transcriptional LysR family regulator|nr:LysR family transcriptional regulator [Puniceicoccales bacterium]